jgi:hypothetical protein
VRSQVKPKVIFWRCIDVLVREKIEVPSYTRLTKLILGAIKRRSQELAAIIERSLTQEVRPLLEDLLTQEPLVGDTVPGKTSAYKLTLMKKHSQSTKPSKVKERVVDLSLVRGLYDQLSPTLQSLALIPGGIRYYAESVLRSEIFQLTRRDDPDRYLHVIAFIAHQFYRLQDNPGGCVAHQPAELSEWRDSRAQGAVLRPARTAARSIEDATRWPRARAGRDSDQHWQHHRRSGAQ